MPVDSTTQKAKFDTVKAVTLLSQGLTKKQIAEALDCNYNALRQWFHRNKVVTSVTQAKVQIIGKLDSDALEKLATTAKNTLAAEVVKQAGELSQSNGALGNVVGIQGRANVLKTVVESAATVFGWKERGGGLSLAVINQAPDPTDESPVIDVTPQADAGPGERKAD